MGIKVLIADDEPLIRMDVKEILMDAGYEVVAEAEDGIDAVELVKQYSPDLVLMDVKMPIMDGLTAAKFIHNENPNIAIVMATAYDDEQFVQKATENGVVGYVVKPISESSLIPAMKVAFAASGEIKNLRSDLTAERRKLEDRKVIERAKGLLIHQKKITEEEAFKFMRTVSMNKRIPMKKVAEMIIAASE